MPRHSLRRNSRRFALALSLMLVAGAVAIPAFAQSSPKYFSVMVDAEFLTCDMAGSEVECDWELTVAFHNESRNTDLGAARITVPDGLTIDGETLAVTTGQIRELPDGRLEATDLEVAPDDRVDITFEGVAVCGGQDEYVFTDPEAKQANDFSGEPGNDLTFLPDASSLSVDLCPFADFKNVVDCEGVEDCTIEEETYRASTGSAKGMMGLRIVSEETSPDEDDIAAALREACDDLLVGVQRLGGAVAHLLPLGMDQEEYITVTSTIPKSHVNTDENRSAHIFQVCFAPEKDTVGVHKDLAEIFVDDKATGLYGPVILQDCGDDVPAPCVDDRAKVRADVVITYRIPAEDPWFM